MYCDTVISTILIPVHSPYFFNAWRIACKRDIKIECGSPRRNCNWSETICLNSFFSDQTKTHHCCFIFSRSSSRVLIWIRSDQSAPSFHRRTRLVNDVKRQTRKCANYLCIATWGRPSCHLSRLQSRAPRHEMHPLTKFQQTGHCMASLLVI